MSDRRLDPEVLAALIDDSLPGAERERVLRQLAECDADSNVLREATDVLDSLPKHLREFSFNTTSSLKLESAGSKTTVLPANPARRRFWRHPLVLAAFPLAAAAALLLTIRAQRKEADPWDTLDVMLSQSESPGARANATQWQGVRGGTTALAPRVQSFRLGARLADLELAVRANDSAQTEAATDRIATLASAMETGAPLVVRVRPMLLGDSSSSNRLTTRVDLFSQARALAPEREYFDLGTWCGVARAAALAGRLEFFTPNGVPLNELARILASISAAGPADTDVDAPHPARALAALQQIISDKTVEASQLSAIAARIESAIDELGR